MREKVAEELDAHCMYLSGAGGNMNSSSSIKEDNVSIDYKDHGRRAANYVIGAEDSYVQASLGDVKSIKAVNEYENDHSMDHLASIAAPIHTMRSQDLDAAKEEVLKHPEIHSIFHMGDADEVRAVADDCAVIHVGAFMFEVVHDRVLF